MARIYINHILTKAFGLDENSTPEQHAKVEFA